MVSGRDLLRSFFFLIRPSHRDGAIAPHPHPPHPSIFPSIHPSFHLSRMAHSEWKRDSGQDPRTLRETMMIVGHDRQRTTQFITRKKYICQGSPCQRYPNDTPIPAEGMGFWLGSLVFLLLEVLGFFAVKGVYSKHNGRTSRISDRNNTLYVLIS